MAHRLDRYGAGQRMDFATSTPEMIADAMIDVLKAPTKFKPVEADGAARAVRMLADLIRTKGRQRFVQVNKFCWLFIKL